MQMWTICAPGRAHVSNHVADRNVLTFLRSGFRHVQINGFHALPVVDSYRAAMQVELANDSNYACGYGMNGCSGRAR